MKTTASAVFALLGVLAATPVAYAGGGSDAGNGGSGIVCTGPNGNIQSVELLDYYEARTLRGMQLDLGDAALSVEAKLKLAIGRLERLDPDLYRSLQMQWQDFFELTVAFFNGVRLIQVPDAYNLYIPAGCQQEQLAVQREPRYKGDRLININKDLWDHLDNNGKAGLILHEMLYAQSVKKRDSRPVRYLTSILSSTDATKFQLSDYIEILNDMEIRCIRSHGYTFEIIAGPKGIEYPKFYYSRNHVTGGPLCKGVHHTATVQNQEISISELFFAEDRSISQLTPAHDVPLILANQMLWFQKGKPIRLQHDQVTEGTLIPENRAVFDLPEIYHLELTSQNGDPLKVAATPEGRIGYCERCTGWARYEGVTFPVSPKGPYSNEFRDWADPGDNTPFSVFLEMPTEITAQGVHAIFLNQISFGWGHVIEGTLAQPTTFRVGASGVKFRDRIKFSHDQRVIEGTLAEDTNLPYLEANGAWVHFFAKMLLRFSGTGQVVSVISERNPASGY